METFTLFLFIHTLVTWMLIGIVWFVQVVHFPLYSYIKKGFHEYERSYLKRTGWLVGPLMLIEAISAIFLLSFASYTPIIQLAAVNLILLVLIWIMTFLFHMSEQGSLAIRFSKNMHEKLVSTNWGRTALWTLRGILILFILGEVWG